ncbi:MAG: hypothetical protein F4X02_16775 [Chloroflexi bacterium]|nr:hypothetical protein [Chloroflexota bacterium]
MMTNRQNGLMLEWLQSEDRLYELEDKRADKEQLDRAEEDYKQSRSQFMQSLSFSAGEHGELYRRASVKRFFDHIVKGQPLTGAEKELTTELKLENRGNAYAVPFGLLENRQTERLMMADTNTSLAQGDFRARIAPPVMPVFLGSDTAFLGIQPQTVQPGQTRIPLVQGGSQASIVAKSTSVDAVDAQISSWKFSPHIARKRVRWSVVDQYGEWGDDLESVLREVLRGSLVERMDDMAMAGSGSSNEIFGLYNSWKGNLLPSNPANANTDFAGYVSKVAGAVDGRYAVDTEGMALVVGTATWAAMSAATQAGLGDAIDQLRRKGVAVRASTRIPAVASKRQDAILALNVASAGQSYAFAVWNAFYVTLDSQSLSDEGDIALTADAYFDGSKTRGAAMTETNADVPGFARLRWQIQA